MYKEGASLARIQHDDIMEWLLTRIDGSVAIPFNIIHVLLQRLDLLGREAGAFGDNRCLQALC